jgi:hypothetical protein
MTLEERKRAALALPAVDPTWDIGDGLILSTGNMQSRFDESHNDAVFWRGDSRRPKEVFQTGFSASSYRAKPVRDYKGSVIWRYSDDDILHESGVSLARDLRGAAFFPFTDDPDMGNDPFEFYLYAVAPSWTASTYRAQQIADAVETGEMRGTFPPRSDAWRKHRHRWGYDPGEDDHGGASCVWQFQEHASLVVEPEQIIGGWQASRSMLVTAGTDCRERAGIRFSVSAKGVARNKMADEDLFAKAKSIATPYDQSYPKQRGHWISFQGIVQGGIGMDDFADAKLHAKQLEAIVVQAQKLNDRADW